MQPLVSVLIPAYNPCEHLFECIQSVYIQTYANIELILVDDYSDDPIDIKPIINKIKDLNSIYRCISTIVVRNTTNEGSAKTRNKLFSLCQGQYIKYLDADDYLYEDCIATQVRLITRENLHAKTHLDTDINNIKEDTYSVIYGSYHLLDVKNGCKRSLREADNFIEYGSGYPQTNSILFSRYILQHLQRVQGYVWDESDIHKIGYHDCVLMCDLINIGANMLYCADHITSVYRSNWSQNQITSKLFALNVFGYGKQTSYKDLLKKHAQIKENRPDYSSLLKEIGL